MTLNVALLINSLNRSYQEILSDGLIPYKIKPTGPSGDPVLNIYIAKEGVCLSFKRDGVIFTELELYLKRDSIKGWAFPNELPLGLKKEMSREWVHRNFGTPNKAVEPRVVLKKNFGWIERYTLDGFPISTVMRFDYDLEEGVESVTFLPTADLRG